MYTTDEFYTNKYLQGRTAVLDTANFPYWERKASMIIQKYTLDRIDLNKPILEDIQLCTCELAECLYNQEKSNHNSNITSEKVGEYSISYATGQSVQELNRSAIKEIIYNWLATTGLLYRGC